MKYQITNLDAMALYEDREPISYTVSQVRAHNSYFVAGVCTVSYDNGTTSVETDFPFSYDTNGDIIPVDWAILEWEEAQFERQ